MASLNDKVPSDIDWTVPGNASEIVPLPESANVSPDTVPIDNSDANTSKENKSSSGILLPNRLRGFCVTVKVALFKV